MQLEELKQLSAPQALLWLWFRRLILNIGYSLFFGHVGTALVLTMIDHSAVYSATQGQPPLVYSS